jgi:hypothetical protein
MLRVRSRVIGGWLLACGLLATAVVGACADKKGALMLAITTDMKAPKDVNAVAISITTNGLVKASFIGRVTPQGDILLPGTLAVVEPDDKNALIRIRVMAFQNQKPRVIRDVRTTAPPGGRTALLRIPLNFVNDGKVAGSDLPNGLVPDPVPGTEKLSPPATSSSSSTPADSGAGAVGTKDLSASGGDFDFMLNFQPKDCQNPQDETIINGECHDSYIDPATLPDFDSAELGDSTGVAGSCFDLTRCFATAVDLGQGAGGPSDAGPGPVEAGVPAADGGVDAPDAAPKPFKDFRPAAVVFDQNTCSIQLNGADPARLNIAIVTPDTGECVHDGECYVPIDRGATGWQDDGAGHVQLPSYLCKFLSAKGLRLATSSDVCAAKLESNPICTPKAGDPPGIFPVADGGGGLDGGADVTFGIPEDFATSVAFLGTDLFFAGQSRVGVAHLAGAPGQPPVAIAGIPGGVNHVPWRFGDGLGQLALANGTSTAYVIDLATTAQSVNVQPATVAGAGVATTFVWASNSPAGTISNAVPGGGQPVAAGGEVTMLFFNPKALAPTGAKDIAMVGDASGLLASCNVVGASATCGQGATLTGQVDAIAPSGPFSGYALTTVGIYPYSVTPDTIMATTVPQAPLLTVPLDGLKGIPEPNGYFAHSLAVAPSCVLFTSATGLEFLVDNGGRPGNSGVVVPARPGQPILGVTVGPDPQHGGLAAYYTVFAAKDPTGGSNGGGIYRVALPPDCLGVAGKDAGADSGTGFDAGAGVEGGACGPANCAGCCSVVAGCQAGKVDVACGNFGTLCQDCTAGGKLCNGVQACQ